MAKKVASLGKGLGALLPPSFSIEPSIEVSRDDGQSVGVTAMIRLDLIRPNPMQPREDFDPIALEDLKKSIREKGVIQPITVRRVEEGHYEIIAGERRFRASTEIGLETIPAYILDIETDAEMLELALIENVQRENLNPIEVALGYKRLMEECVLTQEEVSRKVGKDRTTITNFLRLLKLPAEIQQSLRMKHLSMGHARAILALSDPELQREVFRQVRDSELSVRRTEELVKKVEAGMSVSAALVEAIEKQNSPTIVSKHVQEGTETTTSININTANGSGSLSVGRGQQADAAFARERLRSSSSHAHELPPIDTTGFAIPDDLKDEFMPARSLLSEEHGTDSQATEFTAKQMNSETAELHKIETQLRHILATQVRVKSRANGSGVIEIEFFSPDELERLQELFAIIEREQFS